MLLSGKNLELKNIYTSTLNQIFALKHGLPGGTGDVSAMFHVENI